MINAASGAMWTRGNPACGPLAIPVKALAACNLGAGYGRRGGTTRGNATDGLKYMAYYELACKRKLVKTGGFSRKTLDAAKKILKKDGML
jgi:hypothetical protein